MTFAPLSNGRVDTLPPGAIPVPCTTLPQRRTNSTLGFRVRGSRFVWPTSKLEPSVANPLFQEFVAQQPPHIRRTMQHSTQDAILSQAFADWLSAGQLTRFQEFRVGLLSHGTIIEAGAKVIFQIPYASLDQYLCFWSIVSTYIDILSVCIQ